MVKFYYNQIINGRMTLEQVPIKWRAAVAEMLKEGEQ